MGASYYKVFVISPSLLVLTQAGGMGLYNNLKTNAASKPPITGPTTGIQE